MDTIDETEQQLATKGETDFIEDPDEIFLRAVSEIDTQPLPRKPHVNWFMVVCTLALYLIAGGVGAWYILSYPTVTVLLVPIAKTTTITTTLPLQIRRLQEKTVNVTLSTKTTGRGHQSARSATGVLTFYNSAFTPVTIAAMTLTGTDGVQIVMDTSVTIPAANPPLFGENTVQAHAVLTGPGGNIPALDINSQCCAASVSVKNLVPFSGGQDQARFPVVAKQDQEQLAARVQQALTQSMLHAFTLLSGESLALTGCSTHFTPSSAVGAAAKALTITGSETCQGAAYPGETFIKEAEVAFVSQTQPDANFQLSGSLKTAILSVQPIAVRLTGTWVYHVTAAYAAFLKEHIAGDTPDQATKYLLRTGVIAKVYANETLPADPAHIRFVVASAHSLTEE